MATWVGPAIVAAVISGVISLMGLYLGGWIAIRHEQRRRREKVRDFQVALRAEIRSELHNLQSIDFEGHFEEIKARYAAQPLYWVFPSYPARPLVFGTLGGELQIRPEEVIDIAVLYWRQRSAVERMVDDMRDERFSKLGAERQLEMYGDYIEMQKYLAEIARIAAEALDRSLGEHSFFNSQALARSDL